MKRMILNVPCWTRRIPSLVAHLQIEGPVLPQSSVSARLWLRMRTVLDTYMGHVESCHLSLTELSAVNNRHCPHISFTLSAFQDECRLGPNSTKMTALTIMTDIFPYLCLVRLGLQSFPFGFAKQLRVVRGDQLKDFLVPTR